jgi:phosphocarrier protein
MGEVVKDVVLKNLHGLHVRPAKGFMEEARKFSCDVFVSVHTGGFDDEGEEVNGKSILGLATLGAQCGQALLIRCVGDDAQQACDHLAQYVEAFPENFEEERVEST